MAEEIPEEKVIVDDIVNKIDTYEIIKNILKNENLPVLKNQDGK